MTFEEAAAQLNSVGKEADRTTKREMRSLARKMRADTIKGWPSATGASRRGFTVVDNQEGSRVFNDVEHAFYVGDGQAHRELQGSAKRQERPTVTRIEREITRTLEG